VKNIIFINNYRIRNHRKSYLKYVVRMLTRTLLWCRMKQKSVVIDKNIKRND